MKYFASVLLGFSRDSPRASVARGAVWLVIGLAVISPYWLGGPARDFYASLPSRWLMFVGLVGFIGTLLGALNLTFGGLAWLSRFLSRFN